MTPEEHARVQELVRAARDVDAEKRAEFLVGACGSDARLLAAALLFQDALEVEATRTRLPASPPAAETGSERSPEAWGRSVVLSAAAGGELDPEVRLRDLAQEAPLPELHRGIERYRVLGVLGEGGMGKVYLAHDQDLRRRVALKVVKAPEPERVRRFLEEAQVMGQLQHPAIVPLFDLGLLPAGRLYYTMPVVRGQTLASILRRRERDEEVARRFGLARLMQLFVQVCQAVGYAHAKGVVHRDLKPGNVMVGEHGEVQVLDWGLAKVLREAQVETERTPARASGRLVVGTPSYMSPEQAQGGEVDARTDVWALGVVLYQVLAGELPFRGTGPEALAELVRREVEPPRRRAPARAIPLELEEACLRALVKPVEGRADAGALAGMVQAWLEAESDRARRHELAEAGAAEGARHLARRGELEAEVGRLAAAAAEAARGVEPWRPLEEKRESFAAARRVEEAREALVDASTDVVTALTAALGHEAENPRARGLLAEYYAERFAEAEARGARRDARYYGRLVASFDDGRYAERLRGDGSLALSSDPPGAEVTLHRLVEEGPLLVEREGRPLGRTPLGPVPLAMGSYVAVLRREGHRDTRYPVSIPRNRAWSGEVRLCTGAEIGPGFVHVPAGPCLLGGDEEALNPLPRSEAWVEGFLLAEHPVTMAEYLEFVNDVARREGLAAARLRSPRRAVDVAESSYLVEDGAGGLALPATDPEGDRWDARMPALAVSARDALDYCAWRSARDGLELRLPREEEWEKAARGVDGRWFPWGWGFDPSLCNMRDSRRERPSPLPVDDSPGDRSVYGVRGLGGNVRDWTGTEVADGLGSARRVLRVARGGFWSGIARYCRAAGRLVGEPAHVLGDVGFRLARSLPRPR